MEFETFQRICWNFIVKLAVKCIDVVLQFDSILKFMKNSELVLFNMIDN